jgi:hypothetical protein
MGKGNVIGFKENPVYYIDYDKFDEFDFSNLKCLYDDLVATLKLKNCKFVNRWTSNKGNDWLIFMTFDDLQILLADNEWSVALCCVPNEEYDENAYDVVFTNAANKFMQKLSQLFGLSCRSSAWTSVEIIDPINYPFY